MRQVHREETSDNDPAENIQVKYGGEGGIV